MGLAPYTINLGRSPTRACGDKINSKEKEDYIINHLINYNNASITKISMRFNSFGHTTKVNIQ